MITVERLTKRYGPFTALDDVSFEVRPGQVTGFLGPNGAGKTTAMRVMAGLTPATSGTATVLGTSYSRINNPGRRVGLLLDASAQHAGRTGREVLLARRDGHGGGPLTGGGDDRARRTHRQGGRAAASAHYSLGMRQRLGIAHALLGDPEVLILDEPANGLDPAGIRWMRDLLRGYADRGGTVLLSSHLLNEIERVADEIIVIGGGRIVARGTKDELVASAGTVVRSTHDRVAAPTPWWRRPSRCAPRHPAGWSSTSSRAAVGRIAHDAGIPLTELRAGDGRGLEEIFLDLTADSAREGVAA